MYRPYLLLFLLMLIGVSFVRMSPAFPEKEFLTDKEIAAIQDAQAIDVRVLIYMDAAKLRLKAAEDRWVGKESPEGDPLEFFTPEDMLDGYNRILKSVMTNLDAAFRQGVPEQEKVRRALKTLKESTEAMSRELEILKKLTEEKKKEESWNLTNQAIEITQNAHAGAEYGLSKLSAAPPKKR
jgi:hypothetical protein